MTTNVERFRAPDFSTALGLVRQRLGADAMILGSSSYEPRGWRRLFERPYVEIFAMADLPASVREQAASAAPVISHGDRYREVCARLGISQGAGEYLLRNAGVPLYGDNTKAPNEAFRRTLLAWTEARIVPLDAPRSIALVGPTGAGKTTTLAKLAARYALDRGERVGLVTTDTYRIGAVYHLQTYAEIMGLPWKVAQDPPAMREAMASLAYCDRILIDTSGRNFKSQQARAELDAMLAAAAPEAVDLVVSLTTGDDEMQRVCEWFSEGPPTRMVLTKLDEARGSGKVLTALHAVDLPLAAVTNGQMVPDDLWVPDAIELTSAVWHEVLTVAV